MIYQIRGSGIDCEIVEKRNKTNSQVLTVFFFGINPMVLKVIIDCLRNVHLFSPLQK